MSDPRNMSDFRPIPRDPGLDHTLALGREGYNFISNRSTKP